MNQSGHVYVSAVWFHFFLVSRFTFLRRPYVPSLCLQDVALPLLLLICPFSLREISGDGVEERRDQLLYSLNIPKTVMLIISITK